MARSSPNFIITGGAGFIGSNLTLALQEKFPDARLTVIDDFRSGNFKNLAGYRGDFVAQNLATLNWKEQFGSPTAAGFDAIFHLASITDTTLHDQFIQVHDNVESFRRLLNFARPNKTRIVYASSASTYGAATTASVESNGAAPSNVYAFSKAIMDNPHAHYQNFTEADLERVRGALGYQPQFSLERGVADYVDWLYPAGK